MGFNFKRYLVIGQLPLHPVQNKGLVEELDRLATIGDNLLRLNRLIKPP